MTLLRWLPKKPSCWAINYRGKRTPLRERLLIVTHWTSVLGAWCRWLRGKPVFPDLPILVLGDHDGEQEALEVLDAGADAYLAQPFGTRLLVEQVQSFLDRSESWERRTIGDKSTICVDPVAHRIWVRGREVHVIQRMFRLVQYMAQHPDRVLSVPEISLIITGRNEILQPDTIAVHILRLRKTLKAVGADSWLETVHSFGYRLVIPQPEKIPPSSTTRFLDVLSGFSLACFCRCCQCVGPGVRDGKGRRGTNSPGDRNLCP